MPKKIQQVESGADEFLTQEFVASDLDISLSTLASWACQRRGPPFVKVGRHRRYPVADYKRWKATLPRLAA